MKIEIVISNKKQCKLPLQETNKLNANEYSSAIAFGEQFESQHKLWHKTQCAHNQISNRALNIWKNVYFSIFFYMSIEHNWSDSFERFRSSKWNAWLRCYLFVMIRLHWISWNDDGRKISRIASDEIFQWEKYHWWNSKFIDDMQFRSLHCPDFRMLCLWAHAVMF